MEKEIIKPITLVREELIKNLIELINSQQLPMFVIESILKDLLDEVHNLNIKQTEEDKKKYQEALQKASCIEKSEV